MNHDIQQHVPTMFEQYDDQHSSSVNSYMTRGSKAKHMTPIGMAVVKYRNMLTWPHTLACFLWPTWHRCALFPRPLFGFGLYPLYWALGGDLDGVVPQFEELEEYVAELALADIVKNDPRVQWITWCTPDAFGHTHGVADKDRYKLTVRYLDDLFRKFRERLAVAGQDHNRVYVVATDHGLSHVTQHIDVGKALLQYGIHPKEFTSLDLKLFSQDGDSVDARGSMRGADAVVAVNGNTMNLVYFHNPAHDVEEHGRGNADGWGLAPRRLYCSDLQTFRPGRTGEYEERSVDVLRVMMELEGIELLACLLADDTVEIRRPLRDVESGLVIGSSTAVVERTAGRHVSQEKGHAWFYRYTVLTEADPLYGFDADGALTGEDSPFVVQWGKGPDDPESAEVARKSRASVDHVPPGFYSAVDWLRATHASSFPYGVPRLADLMLAPEGADVVLTALDMYDMAPRGFEAFIGDYAGGHGGLRADQLRVPFLMSGPGIPHSSVETALVEDVGSYLLSRLRIPMQADSRRVDPRRIFDYDTTGAGPTDQAESISDHDETTPEAAGGGGEGVEGGGSLRRDGSADRRKIGDAAESETGTEASTQRTRPVDRAAQAADSSPKSPREPWGGVFWGVGGLGWRYVVPWLWYILGAVAVVQWVKHVAPASDSKHTGDDRGRRAGTSSRQLHRPGRSVSPIRNVGGPPSVVPSVKLSPASAAAAIARSPERRDVSADEEEENSRFMQGVRRTSHDSVSASHQLAVAMPGSRLQLWCAHTTHAALKKTAGLAVADALVKAPVSLGLAYMLWLFFGWFGLHHLYMGRPARAALYAVTFGLFGIGTVVDVLLMPWYVRSDQAQRKQGDAKKTA